MVTQQSKILPLENGDRLSCREFERRDKAMSEVKKVVLIVGRREIAFLIARLNYILAICYLFIEMRKKNPVKIG